MVNKFKVGDIVRFKKRYSNFKFLNKNFTQTFEIIEVRSKFITITPTNELNGHLIYIFNMNYFVKTKKWRNKNYDNITRFFIGENAIIINNEYDYILLLRYLEQIRCNLLNIFIDNYNDKDFMSILNDDDNVAIVTRDLNEGIKFTLYPCSYLKNQSSDYLTVEDLIQ